MNYDCVDVKMLQIKNTFCSKNAAKAFGQLRDIIYIHFLKHVLNNQWPFLKEINTILSKDTLNWSKISKDVYFKWMLFFCTYIHPSFTVSNNCVFLFIHLFLIIRTVSWAANQLIRKITRDTEDWSNGCWKFNIAFTQINYILTYNQIENSYFEL